jgi:hypothetical protein
MTLDRAALKKLANVGFGYDLTHEDKANILSLLAALEAAEGQIEDQARTLRDAITQRDEAQTAGMLERKRGDDLKARAETAEKERDRWEEIAEAAWKRIDAAFFEELKAGRATLHQEQKEKA